MKKPPQKVAYLSRNSVVSEIFFLLPYICPTALIAEFMFQNVAYRATVCITGVWVKGNHTFYNTTFLRLFFDMTKADAYLISLRIYSCHCFTCTYYVLRSIYEFMVKVLAQHWKVFLQLTLVTCTHFPRSMFQVKAYLFVNKLQDRDIPKQVIILKSSDPMWSNLIQF